MVGVFIQGVLDYIGLGFIRVGGLILGCELLGWLGLCEVCIRFNVTGVLSGMLRVFLSEEVIVEFISLIFVLHVLMGVVYMYSVCQIVCLVFIPVWISVVVLCGHVGV